MATRVAGEEHRWRMVQAAAHTNGMSRPMMNSADNKALKSSRHSTKLMISRPYLFSPQPQA